jgi:hypothetical protein
MRVCQFRHFGTGNEEILVASGKKHSTGELTILAIAATTSCDCQNQVSDQTDDMSVLRLQGRL